MTGISPGQAHGGTLGMGLTKTGLWANPDSLRLWAAQTISFVGSQVTLVALPLTAVVTLNASAEAMGILRAVELVPALLLGLFVGAWVDRLRRKPVLVVADVGRALLLGTIPQIGSASCRERV